MLGSFCSSILVAFCFNGKLYSGSFDQAYQLSFQAFMAVLLLPAAITFYLCWFRVQELSASEELDLECDVKSSDSFVVNSSLQDHFRKAWVLLKSNNFFCVAMFLFWQVIMCQVSTPALNYVSYQWAGVKMLQASLANVFGILLSAVGFRVAQMYLLNLNWRVIIGVTVVATVVLDAVPQALTIFDVFSQPVLLSWRITHSIHRYCCVPDSARPCCE